MPRLPVKESAMAETALIVGVGSGLSASLARLFAREGMKVALAARNTDKLGALVKETGARAYACDAGDPASVATLYEQVDKDLGGLDVAVYNASARARGPVGMLAPDAIAETYLHIHRQQRSAWTWEVELRPWVETF